MESFLSLVARDLYRRHAGDLSRTAVVFPNKRAGLFFNDCLAPLSDKPVWAPAYLTISELMGQRTSLLPADPIRMVCELHRIFCEETGSLETLDDFYFWGELLISDFDDLDKNLVDADQLFQNLSELREISPSNDFLTEEQVEAIRLFFANFSPDRKTELKERFMKLWNALDKIYHRFREELAQSGTGYEGMRYRQAVEKPANDGFGNYDCYAFVGFNVLNKSEHTLFRQAQATGKALFYWDYDRFYKDNPYHEAGEFIRRNLADFPQALQDDAFDCLSHPKKIRCLSAQTENAQARYMAEWTANLPTDCPERENAIVLCNEALLMPVCHSLSAAVQEINVTMGFPLRQTPIVDFISTLLDLQIHGYDAQRDCFRLEKAVRVLRHSCFALLSEQGNKLAESLQQSMRLFPTPQELQADEASTLLFTPHTDRKELMEYLLATIRSIAAAYRDHQSEDEKDNLFNQLYHEALFKTYTTLRHVDDLMEEGVLDLQPETLCTLLAKLLQQLSIPFHGEPAAGLQIMGILETRNLDFKRLAILSLGEGLLPKGSNRSASFIPYNLRKAFGMTTPEYEDAVYAYYFYRLLQRAEDVTFLYNDFSENAVSREASRFLLQFLLEYPSLVSAKGESSLLSRAALVPQQSACSFELSGVEKTQQVCLLLQERFDVRKNPKAFFSPSALNSYIDCPLRFYLQHVLRLRAPQDMTDDIDSAQLGTLFHYAAQLLYSQILPDSRKIVSRTSIHSFLEDKEKLELLLDRVFASQLFHLKKGEKLHYNGLHLLYRNVIKTFIINLLRYDEQRTPFAVLACEHSVLEDISLELPGKLLLPLRIGGTIDRLDRQIASETPAPQGEYLRIMDYKTGSKRQKNAASVEELFVSGKDRPYYAFQAFFYSAIVSRKAAIANEPDSEKQLRNQPVRPALFYPRLATSPRYSTAISIGEPRKAVPVMDFAKEYEAEFRERLRGLLKEIFDPSVPFYPCRDKTLCTYCDCRSLCHFGDAGKN